MTLDYKLSKTRNVNLPCKKNLLEEDQGIKNGPGTAYLLLI